MPRLITAMITPFSGSEVDLEGLKRNLTFQIEGGVEGILILGTTGESPTLSREERRAIIETTVAHVEGEVPVWVGTGTNGTHTTIELTREAEELGADVALVVTPYYNCPDQEGILAHYSTLCEATKIPLCLYNIPKRTGRNISLETMEALAKLPHILGVKESYPDVSQAARFIPHLTVWSGDDALTLPLMALGARGIISVASNLIPREMRSLVDTISEGDLERARTQFYTLFPLFEALSLQSNPIPIKAAMEMCGMPAGTCRLPLGTLSTENRQKLEEVYGYAQS